MEEHNIQHIRNLVKPGFVCMDIGAHEGILSEEILKALDHFGKLYIFEILDRNLYVLNKKFGEDPNVIIVHKAVSDKTGTCTLYLSPIGSTYESNIIGVDMNNRTMRKSIEIDSICIDDFMKSIPPKLDFIKMDIEGAEHLALNGMKDTLKNLRPIMCIEFHNDLGWSGRKIIYDSDYKLLAIYHNEMLNQWIDYEHSRVYHCLAVPKEKEFMLDVKSRTL